MVWACEGGIQLVADLSDGLLGYVADVSAAVAVFRERIIDALQLLHMGEDGLGEKPHLAAGVVDVELAGGVVAGGFE